MLQKLDVISSIAHGLEHALFSKLPESFDSLDTKSKNKLVDDIASEIANRICSYVFQSDDINLHPNVRKQISSAIKPLILKKVKDIYKAIDEIYKENNIDIKTNSRPISGHWQRLQKRTREQS